MLAKPWAGICSATKTKHSDECMFQMVSIQYSFKHLYIPKLLTNNLASTGNVHRGYKRLGLPW